LVADPSQAKKLLSWEAKYSLDQIVATAWNWAQSRKRTAK
jgi:UDP-glucose 4-epimerase